MTTIVLFSLLFVFMLIGVPVAISLGMASIIAVFFFSSDSITSIPIKMFEVSEHYTLLAIPFFILAGAFMSTGGVAKRLINFANASVGHISGGLAIASVLSCMLFAALSGSSPATVASVGTIAIAGMVKSGYPKGFATGVITNAGTLGILIPPSVVMVVYAAATESSVGKLFIAGVMPGVILGLTLMVVIYVIAKIKKFPAQPRTSLKEWLASARQALWGISLIAIILLGIYLGIFTATEAAVVAAFYAFLVAVFIYKDIKFKEVPKVILEAGKLSVMLMFIIANAMVFSHVLTSEQIPQYIVGVVKGWDLSTWQFLLIINVVLLIAGAFMEPSAIILIVVPIIFPISQQLGIDPIHLGIMIVVNMEIGLITPPVGLNLFVASAITKQPLEVVIKNTLPWLLVMLLFLILITNVPSISLWLPELIGIK